MSSGDPVHLARVLIESAYKSPFAKEEKMQDNFPKKPGPLNDQPDACMIEGYLSERVAREGLPKGGYPNLGGVPTPTVDHLEMESSAIEALDPKATVR